MQQQDQILSKVFSYCQTGWPNKRKVEIEVMPFWKEGARLTVRGQLQLYDRRIVDPKVLQWETLKKGFIMDIRE